MTGKQTIWILGETITGLQEENDQMRAAIKWALGEGDSNFGEHKGNHGGPYWWRKELRERAFGEAKK